MATQRPAGARTPPARESTQVRDSGPDTVWHTRGKHGHSRLQTPLPPAARSPKRQLPPSPVPRLLMWALLLALAAAFVNAVRHMLH